MTNLIVLGCFCDQRTAYWEPRSAAVDNESADAKRKRKRDELEEIAELFKAGFISKTQMESKQNQLLGLWDCAHE